MDEVRGQLAVGILPDVLRHVAFLQESGRLEVRSEALHGWIDLHDGRPLHAAFRRSDGSEVQGLEALSSMLAWPHGTYAFELRSAEAPPPGRDGAAHDNGSPHGEPDVVDGPRGTPLGSSGTARARLRGMRDAAEGGATADAGQATARRTLAGSTEAVLEAARALAGRRNGFRGDLKAHGDPEAAHERVDPVAPVPAPAAAPQATAQGSPSAEELIRAAPHEPRIRGASVLLRAPNVPPGRVVRVSYGALELWRHLDGNASLATLADRLAEDVHDVRSRADELLLAGIARVAPQPMYGTAFVAGLIEALNEIMGPMGEILVEDALIDHDLDPRGIPQDRIDDLTTTLTKQLRRSDWQLKLRARVARLRADTVEASAEETP